MAQPPLFRKTFYIYENIDGLKTQHTTLNVPHLTDLYYNGVTRNIIC